MDRYIGYACIFAGGFIFGLMACGCFDEETPPEPTEIHQPADPEPITQSAPLEYPIVPDDCWLETIEVICSDGGDCAIWGIGVSCSHQGPGWTLTSWRY